MHCCEEASRHKILKTYEDMINRNTNPLFDLKMIFDFLGPTWQKPMWVAWQAIYTVALINTTYYSYFL